MTIRINSSGTPIARRQRGRGLRTKTKRRRAEVAAGLRPREVKHSRTEAWR